jgi:hypothetical protein
VQAVQRANTGTIDSSGNLTFVGGTALALSNFTGAGTCAPSANALATLISDGDSVNTGIYLARVNDGNATDNRMTVDEDLGGNNINNANSGTFSGNLYAADVIHTSDRRKKREIEVIKNPWTLISSIHGYRYVLNDTDKPDDGLMADEIEKRMPELVKLRADGFKGANYEGIIAPLVEEIRWQHKEIERLKRMQEAGRPSAPIKLDPPVIHADTGAAAE